MPNLPYWRQVPAHRRWLLVEAFINLHAARLALKLVPFQRLTWYFERPARRPELTGAARSQAKHDVRWSAIMISRRFSESLVCFPRGMAVQAMLRRRGVSTTLYYGAKRAETGKLTAHVWVQDGDEGIIGNLARPGHKVLARYPARQGN